MSQLLKMMGLVRLFDDARGTHEVLLQSPAVEFTRNTTIKAAVSQAVTTTAANINIGSVTSEGDAFLWNDESDTASTTYIIVGFDEGGAFRECFRLAPKKFCIIDLAPERTWQVKTNTSTAVINGYILQRNA